MILLCDLCLTEKRAVFLRDPDFAHANYVNYRYVIDLHTHSAPCHGPDKAADCHMLGPQVGAIITDRHFADCRVRMLSHNSVLLCGPG